MICEMDITWTRRTARNPEKEKKGISFQTLLDIIKEALKPFDEARAALSRALIAYRPEPSEPIYPTT
jgi:hypothetical protein